MLLILLPLTALVLIAVREALHAAGLDQRDAGIERGVAGLVEKLPDPLDGWVRRQLQKILPGQMQKLQSRIGTSGRWALRDRIGDGEVIGHLLFQLAMMLIAFFFLLVSRHDLVDWLLPSQPPAPDRLRGVLTELRVVARSVLGANFITSAAQAAVATVGFLIARAPSPIFFGLLTLITSMIPSIGSALITLPVAGLLLLTGHRWAALFLMIWALFVVGLIEQFLSPVLIKGGAANLHGALIFFSLIGAIPIRRHRSLPWAAGADLLPGPGASNPSNARGQHPLTRP